MTDPQSILDGLELVRDDLEELYRDLHRHPELSHQEERTSELVADRLREMGLDVTTGIGGTGVVGVLENGDGPRVLLRADMDALPVEEATGLDYASTVTTTDSEGGTVGIMHACGHDMHVTALLGAAQLLASSQDAWAGTLVALFQPAEEHGDGAQAMVDDGLADLVGEVDVALGQHVLPAPSGWVATRVGPAFAAADSMRITLHGRGAHGSSPHAAVDPVVLAAMVVLRLQTVVSREIPPAEFAVLTVGSVRAGSTSNVIPDRAVIELNVRTYSDQIREQVLDAIRRIVDAECQASGSPKKPEFELFGRFPLTTNDADVTQRISGAFDDAFGKEHVELPMLSGSEDFSDIPNALGVPYTYWGFGGTDPETFAAAESAGRLASDIPMNHSAFFAPVVQPTLDVGVKALVVAALAYLA